MGKRYLEKCFLWIWFLRHFFFGKTIFGKGNLWKDFWTDFGKHFWENDTLPEWMCELYNQNEQHFYIKTNLKIKQQNTSKIYPTYLPQGGDDTCVTFARNKYSRLIRSCTHAIVLENCWSNNDIKKWLYHRTRKHRHFIFSLKIHDCYRKLIGAAHTFHSINLRRLLDYLTQINYYRLLHKYRKHYA